MDRGGRRRKMKKWRKIWKPQIQHQRKTPPHTGSKKAQGHTCPNVEIYVCLHNVSFQELSGNPNPWYFLKSIAGTNGRRTAVQMVGVLQYKLEVYFGVSLSSKL